MYSEPIKIAILAMGGEGGGVLADWIVDLGEENGWFAQTTSVPGVAQRTGATTYYVELFPGADQLDARVPVLAQSPMPGDVDIVLASELMEAGRAVQRGFVTPDLTTLVASTHRVYAIAEKSHLGDGRVDSDALQRQIRRAARRLVAFDMARTAERNGSVVSAVLFGALSGAGVLPFSRTQFEATIERGGVGVKASLAAFADAFEQARIAQSEASRPTVRAREGGRQAAADEKPALPDPATVAPRHPEVARLVEHARGYPAEIQPIVIEGIRRCVDYQDPAYGRLYLERLDAQRAAPGGQDIEMMREVARHLALWMTYEDTIRVADLKIRGSRFERVRDEVHSTDGQVLSISEYMHPRIEEICETLPAGLGRWLSRPHAVHRLVARLTREGRVVTTSSLGGFFLLYALAWWGRWRRVTLRHAVETARIEAWLGRLRAAAAIDPRLALEAAKCQTLVRGYSDTHERGLRNYEIIMTVLDRHAKALAPAILRELRNAALADEHGRILRDALARRGFPVDGLFAEAGRSCP
ncbi:indolepyruvate oxidoreductase subunit beta family protein [Castellaniella sp.]|uniref:indolepyruvate oxidoreductase subunit beta family protein n=1 Tax=Castellaniella sp. TaxID=1955812 RepID=UPI002AFFB3E4|nr:indolepyruvate oxidoreductase subunit beta family protein [Castellaniella sp.]